MDTVDDKKSLVAERYEVVNAAWPPQLPPLTEREAITAARRLYRFGFSLFDQKKSYKGKVVMTSGNRTTWVYPARPSGWSRGDRYLPRREAMMRVNASSGWHELVHDLSHYVHTECRPRESAHRDGHAWVERQMIDYVVRSGWLSGKLHRPERPKLQSDPKVERCARLQARLAKWEARQRRAQNAIKKIRRSLQRYQRAGIAA